MPVPEGECPLPAMLGYRLLRRNESIQHPFWLEAKLTGALEQWDRNCPPPSETPPPKPSFCAQPCSFLLIAYCFVLFCFVFPKKTENVLFVLKFKVAFAKYDQIPFADKIGKIQYVSWCKGLFKLFLVIHYNTWLSEVHHTMYIETLEFLYPYLPRAFFLVAFASFATSHPCLYIYQSAQVAQQLQ